MSAKPKFNLLFTQRALVDLKNILKHVTRQLGAKAAGQYLTALEAGLERILEQPKLLQEAPELPLALSFYRVSKHAFVIDTQAKSLVVLAVVPASRGVPNRLAELQPLLGVEVELLHQKLQRKRRRGA